MGTDQGGQPVSVVLPTLDLRKVKEKLQVGDSQISPRKNKTDIFSPRSPIYRAPLSSRRNNNNVPSGSGNAAGFILPQAPYIGSLQQQHLQHNNASLYSPRSRTHYQSALQAQQAASLLSPRQRAHRTSTKDHPSSNAHSKQSQPAAHAASAASRPAIPVLRLQLQQPQAQLFSPRQYHKPAPLGGLSPRAAPHLHGATASHHAQAQPGGALTWRGPTTGTSHPSHSQGQRQHQPQQQYQPQQQQPQAQSVQTPAATASVSRASAQASNSSAQKGSGSKAPSLTPSQALQAHSHALTGYEQSEILNQPDIYFLGVGARKIEGQPHNSDLNHGYDDEWGDYKMVAGDHIGYRFEIMSRLGKGSFGQVLKCRDHKTGELCALKVIRNQKRFHKQALIEIKILEHLRAQDSDNSSYVVHVRESLSFRNHLCISFELLSINLYDYIKANNFKGSSLRLIRKFAYQVLVCLRFLKRQQVLHCDLKPENILLKESGRSGVKVIDFGSSCFEGEQVYSYIQSRFYRSPEVMLGLRYGPAIDMWSLACILAELYTGYPLFPGENEVEQMQLVVEMMGLPPGPLMDRATRKDHFFEANGGLKMTPSKAGLRCIPATKDLAQALKCTDAQFLSFLQACLRWDPKDRMTPEEALQHPWIQSMETPTPVPQPAPAPLTQGWTPRNLNPSSTWLSRLQTDVASQAAGDGSKGKQTSRQMQSDASQMTNMPQSGVVTADGALSHRGNRAYAGQSAKRH